MYLGGRKTEQEKILSADLFSKMLPWLGLGWREMKLKARDEIHMSRVGSRNLSLWSTLPPFSAYIRRKMDSGKIYHGNRFYLFINLKCYFSWSFSW